MKKIALVAMVAILAALIVGEVYLFMRLTPSRMGGTYTPNIGLYKPDVGETGWGTLVSGGATTLDTIITRNTNSIILVTNITTSITSSLSFTAGTGKIPKGQGTFGYLQNSWGGGANSLATLDGSAKVSQSPAISQTTPAAGRIPVTLSGGRLDNWLALTPVVIDIGDWDMYGTSNLAIAHGRTFSTIRVVEVMIRNDANALLRRLEYSIGGSMAYYYEIDSTYITLYSSFSGPFYSTDYDQTGYNRGWITIWYTN